MNEVKNKNFILISCGACLVIVMLILYFSGLNVAKGSYGAEGEVDSSGNTYTCSQTGYKVVEDSDGNARCCPSGYKLKGIYCIPNGCNDYGVFDTVEVKCTTVAKECYQKAFNSDYYISFSASFHGKTCTLNTGFFSEDSCKNAKASSYNCSCSCSELRVNSTNAIKKDETDNNITIKFYNGNAMVKEGSCVKGSCNSITAPGPQSITRSGYSFYNSSKEYEFTGWGSSSCLTTVGYGASYPAYHNFDNNSLTASVNYYACYREKKTVEEPDKFDVNKCNFSQEYTVTFDVNYKNCKYINIGYNSSQSERTEANVKACCIAKGWTWVGYNFNSSGNDYEYCVKCGGGSPSPSSPSSPSNPSSPSIPSSTPSSMPSSSSNIDKNPPTGSIAIFMVWVIALGAIVYSFFYFKQSRFE